MTLHCQHRAVGFDEAVTDGRPFEHEYRGCDLHCGRGCIDRLDDYLAAEALERALIVCRSNVGVKNKLRTMVEAVMGDRLVGAFNATTPEKRAETAYEVIDEMDERDADVLVGVGGGNSLDIARQAIVFAADGRYLSDLREETRRGSIGRPESIDDRTPVVVIPSRFAGANV